MSDKNKPDIPCVAIYNNLENSYNFLNRSKDPLVVQARLYHGDHGLFWFGPHKLLFVTTYNPHAEAICRRWGYSGTIVLAPEQPTFEICNDILREEPLVGRLVEYAGQNRRIQLVPYATTPQLLNLAKVLEEDYGLEVSLPESLEPEHLWLRDYFNTKAGFRTMVSQWLVEENAYPSDDIEMATLPDGTICEDKTDAARVVQQFNTMGKPCVVKANLSVSGFGHTVFHPNDYPTTQKPYEELLNDPFLGQDPIVVEEYIVSDHINSPSIEIFVPPLSEGKPFVTHLATQIIEDYDHFCGVIISKDLYNAVWFPTLKKSGLLIANHLQQQGFIGHFDLDTIVDGEGNIYLLEANARRTGSTHVHEFARFTFGPNYLDKLNLLSIRLSSGVINTPERLFALMEDLFYPNHGAQKGIIIFSTTSLKIHEFECIIVAPTFEEIIALRQTLIKRIEKEK